MPKLYFNSTGAAWQRKKSHVKSRRGAIAVLTAVLLVVLLAAVAFAIDMGMICLARTELQRSADASALAATSELLYRLSQDPANPELVVSTKGLDVRQVADSAAQDNKVFQESPDLQHNADNVADGEIVIGEMIRLDGVASLQFDNPSQYNSVAVRVRRTHERNGELPLFFGRVLGMNSVPAEAVAQAAFIKEFKGFRVPAGDGDPLPTLRMLPFAIERTAWDKCIAGVGSDDYCWNKEAERVEHGHGDGSHEINLYPLATGASGNFGTVDIGSDMSSNPTLARQIVEGLSRQDLDYHGGQLALNSDGKLLLSGDPGIKDGAILPAVDQIIGQTRIVPLYSSVSGQGQNAIYTITAFGACRVLTVDLHSGDKHLTVQPAAMITRGGIPGDGTHGSTYIFSPIVLVR